MVPSSGTIAAPAVLGTDSAANPALSFLSLVVHTYLLGSKGRVIPPLFLHEITPKLFEGIQQRFAGESLLLFVSQDWSSLGTLGSLLAQPSLDIIWQ